MSKLTSAGSRNIKAAGRMAENAVVDYLKARGYPAERRRLTGSSDRGDIAGVPNTVIEVKNEKSIDLAGYLKELGVEKANDGAERGVVVVRKRGTVFAGEWYAVLPFADYVDLIRIEDVGGDNVGGEAG